MSASAPDVLLDELRQLVTELSLISHVSGTSYEGKVARDTSEGIGGNRPPGGDGEHRPRAPRTPLIEGDARSEKAWEEFEEELAAWQRCYHRRTPAYFSRELARCEAAPSLAAYEHRLRALVNEARETLAAWRRMPIPLGQPPEFGSSQWKRYVAESSEDAGVLATRFNCTRRYIKKVQQQYGRRAA